MNRWVGAGALLAAVAVTAGAQQTAGKPAEAKGLLNAALHSAAKSHKAVMVLFGATW
ncbi:MAG TPA: hypothetical protein VGS41_18585 [Chthonomonadales bacterium]|nr:hypothetical protein [Chthonomonadales bacterium]